MCVDQPSQVLSQRHLTGSKSLKLIGHLTGKVEFCNKNRPIKQPKCPKQDKDFQVLTAVVMKIYNLLYITQSFLSASCWLFV
jgi:hypothetical protein